MSDDRDAREDGDAGVYREDLPMYRCEKCDTRPRLMVDKTAGMSTVGVGCGCTLKNGRPFFSLRSSLMNLPERWSA